MRILSIDGGGTRGILPATLLADLEKHCGQAANQWADVIAGSATGGILALALGCGLSPARIAELYETEAAFLFKRTFPEKLKSGFGMFGPRYSLERLFDVLSRYFGKRTIGDIHANSKGKTTYLIPTTSLDATENGEPCNLKPLVIDSSNPQHQTLSVVEVAMRTAAAPMFFRIHETFIEGGIVANNPSAIALSWVLQKENVDKKNIRLLSLGCGTPGKARLNTDQIGNGKWGMLNWLGFLQPLIIDSNMAMSWWHVETMLQKNQYLRIHPNFSSQAVPSCLRLKKVRLDVKDPEQLFALKEMGHHLFIEKKDELKDLLQL